MDQFIRKGFILAGIVNIVGILTVSEFFTNPWLTHYDPLLFNSFGVLMIILWGVAYIATANSWRLMRTLVMVFAIEKLAYGWSWALWMMPYRGQLGEIFEQSFLTGLFYATYGVIDLAFCAFFLFAWMVAGKQGKG